MFVLIAKSPCVLRIYLVGKTKTLSLLLGKLETDVSAGTDAHQSQQRRAELRHAEIVVDGRHEDDSQHNRPRENLKAMKAIAAAVSQNVTQQALAIPLCARRANSLKLLIELGQTRATVLQLFVQAVPVGRIVWSQGRLSVDRA